MEWKIYKQGYGLKPIIPNQSIPPLKEDGNVFFTVEKRTKKLHKGNMIRDMKCAKNMDGAD